jgi:Glycine zipper 2TM domain
MKFTSTLFAGAASLVLLAGCETMSAPQRNAAIGGGIGALAGAAIADNDLQGALIGGALGAAVGYYTGCRQQGGCFVGGERVAGERQFDSRVQRYYFVDSRTGRTYWDNGDPRTS